MNKINLETVFNLVHNQSKLPDWFRNCNNCVYYIHPLLPEIGNGYVGETKNLLIRFLGVGPRMHYGAYINKDYPWSKELYDALRNYGPFNFEIIVCEQDIEDKYLRWEREKYWNSYYHTFIEDGGFNHDHGGKTEQWNTAGRAKMKELFPDTNGINPDTIAKGREALKAKYGRYISDTSLKAAHDALKRKYPKFNGMSEECQEKGRIAGLKAIKEKYGSQIPPQNLGAPGRAIAKRAYSDLIKMTEICEERHIDVITKDIYNSIKLEFKFKIAQYRIDKLKLAFTKYRDEYKFDMTRLLKYFPTCFHPNN